MDKKIEHIGNLGGRLMLFGGVYSNLQALEKLISIAKVKGIAAENCICTGDIVGYCAQPEETVRLLKNWGARSIAGNVEKQLVEGANDCGCDFTKGSRCDGFSKNWYAYAQGRLSKASLMWMGQLSDYIRFEYAGKKIMVVHGSFEHISEFIFKSTPKSIKENNFQLSKSDVIIAGHCGLPFNQEVNGNLWLNPGVVGMPANDGTQRVWYLILDDSEGKLEYTHQYFEYDCRDAYNLMCENHLPSEYAATLISGIWDNMEILPKAEKLLQGIPYNFDVGKKNLIKTKTHGR